MNPQEIDQAIGELETRLERLRVLYEHYFMGMERIEPAVARKDVDRRFYNLRKVRIQNTAKRFKLQTLVQRYNTLQQYWTRTCREIEQGTYRRHRLRAERSMAALDETKRTGDEAAEKQERAARAAGALKSAEDELAALIHSGTDPQIELKSAIDDLLTRPAGPEASPSAASKNLLSQLGDSESGATAPRPAPAPAPKRPSSGAPPQAPPPKPPSSSAPPLAARRPPSSNAPRPVPAGRPNPPSSRTSTPGAGPPSPPPPRRPIPPPGSAAPPSPTAASANRPAPASPRPTGVQPASPAAARPAQPPAARPTPAAGPPKGGGLDDARIRELHSRYSAARRTTGAGDVSLDQLRDRLRATEEKLRKQHANRNIDFDVVVKGGKAIIKPKVS